MQAIPALFLVVIFIFGCGGGAPVPGPSPSPQNADVSGPWQFTGTSTVNPSLTPVVVEADLTDLNASIGSTALVALNSLCGPGTILVGGVSGSVGRNTVTATASFGGQSVAFFGMVSGSSIAGTYGASGTCGVDVGKITGVLLPKASGTYSGNVTSHKTGLSVPVTAHIAVDASLSITGSASVSSVCFNQLTLSGLQVGAGAELTATDPQGDKVTFLLISTDNAFGSIAGLYSVDAGGCSGDTGSATLTRTGN